MKHGAIHHLGSRLVDGRCGGFYVLVREGGDVRWIPLLRIWKLDPNILMKEKKSDGFPTLISFSGLVRHLIMAACMQC